ncbi:hypothetical protein [Chondromyces apiculatus]|nr:hypothetical protein [Chondromyces apiculatus]
MRLRFARRALLPAGALGLVAALLQGACSHPWDDYDPRVGEGTGPTSGTGAGTPGEACSLGDVRACYTGAPGTEGTGICTGGLVACQADGTFGACQNQQLPAAETCDGRDEDCDGEVDEQGSCYGGAEGTADVGVCRRGWLFCDVGDGGICLGEVRPSLEECVSGVAVDEDCDGAVNDHCALWSRRFGGDGDDVPYAFALDGSGALLLAGAFASDLDFGSTTLSNQGGNDVFVAKLDGSGEAVWSTSFGDGEIQEARGLAVDPGGFVYVTGRFESTMDPMNGNPVLTSAGANDVFLLKLDPDGSAVWGQRFGNALNQAGLAVAADAGGAVVVGYFNGAITLGAETLTSADGEDGFVFRVDGDGEVVWQHRLGGALNDRVTNVALAADGEVVVTGFFSSQLTVGDATFQAAGTQDGFVARFGANGMPLQATALSGAGAQQTEALAVGPDKQVIVGGSFGGAMDIMGQTVQAEDAADGFVILLDGGGSPVWGHALQGAGEQIFRAATFDGEGNALLGMTLEGQVDFQGEALLSAGAGDMLVLKLSPAGEKVFARRFGDVADQDPRVLALDGSGNLVLVGDCVGTVDFGSGATGTAAQLQDQEDICVAKLAR